MRTAPLALVSVILGGSLTLSACKSPVRSHAPTIAPDRTGDLDRLLDLVPEGSGGLLIVRDPRTLLDGLAIVLGDWWGEGGEGVEQVAPGFSDRLPGIEQLRDALVESGVHLERGLALGGVDGVVVIVGADDVEAVPTALWKIAPNDDLTRRVRCKVIAGTGMVACAAQAEVLASYTPGRDAKGLRAWLEADLDGATIERANVLFSGAGDGPRSTVAAAIAPGVLQLDIASDTFDRNFVVPSGEPAWTLAALQPGASFVWARLDPVSIAASMTTPPPALAPDLARAFTGEFSLAAAGSAGGVASFWGISDRSTFEQLLPVLSLAANRAPKLGDGTTMRASIEAIDVGAAAPQPILRLHFEPGRVLAPFVALGLAPEAIVWVTDRVLVSTLGSEDSAVGALLPHPEGPSAAFLAALPPELAAALRDGTTSLAAHVELDALQSPRVQAAMRDMLSSSAAGPALDAEQIEAGFHVASSLSSLSMWTTPHGEGSIIRTAWRSFGDDSTAEGRAARAARRAVAAHTADPATAYGALASAYPRSQRVAAYRVRAGLDEHGTQVVAQLVAAVALLSALRKTSAPAEQAVSPK